MSKSGTTPSRTSAARPLVLFVCTGNICRSPMAEALLRHHLPPGTPWRVASAGTLAFDGDEPSEEILEALAEVDICLPDHHSQPLTAERVCEARVIVAMTRGHRDDILERFPSAAQKVFLLRSFDPRADDDKNIADPIGGNLSVYRRCRDDIAAAIPGLVEFLGDLNSH
ncbi:MAG: low molecular weight protein arginine phosphatase [bacterium]